MTTFLGLRFFPLQSLNASFDVFVVEMILKILVYWQNLGS